MPQLFQFDKSLNPKVVAGVPPDYFSNTGQLWGNPIYNWKKMKKERFQWWIQRVEASLELFDWIRIDHFRGFSAYWAVPFGNPTAATGKWIPASGKELFKALKKHFGDLKIIAEDLGEITPDVLELRDAFNFPGMKILQYAFFSDDNENMPHNFTQNCVVYTGTHDNETTAGWYLNQDEKTKERIHTYLQSDGTDIHWKLIRLAWSSAANIAIVPMQDLLGLDNSARMNVPGTVGNKNWQWQLLPQQLNEETFRILRFLTVLFGRNLSKQ
jgi:4-alpha-glucanotransferase